ALLVFHATHLFSPFIFPLLMFYCCVYHPHLHSFPTRRSSDLHSSRLVGSDTLCEFNRGQLEVSRYYPVGRRGAFAWRVLGGTILPARRISLAGQSIRFVPPDQRFYGGGPNSVRGYARNELGPRVYVQRI